MDGVMTGLELIRTDALFNSMKEFVLLFVVSERCCTVNTCTSTLVVGTMHYGYVNIIRNKAGDACGLESSSFR